MQLCVRPAQTLRSPNMRCRRHITVANFDTTGYASPQAALADARKALAACSLAWRLPTTAKLLAWDLYASQGWGTPVPPGTPDTKTYVITASDPALDKYAACVKAASPRIYDVKGPNEPPRTPWHVGLYGLEASNNECYTFSKSGAAYPVMEWKHLSLRGYYLLCMLAQ